MEDLKETITSLTAEDFDDRKPRLVKALVHNRDILDEGPYNSSRFHM